MKKFMLLLLAFLLFALTAKANVYKALEDVYNTNPNLTSQRENLKAAETKIQQAYAGWKPGISVGGAMMYVDGKAAGRDLDDDTVKGIGAYATQNLFEGFKTQSQIKAAKYLVMAEKSRLYDVEQSTFLAAINAYIDVLNAKEVLHLQKNNQAVLTKYYELYYQKFKVGVLTQTDVAQAEARLERAKTEVINAQANYNNALEVFRNIYGYTLDKYDDIKFSGLGSLFPENINQAEDIAQQKHPYILYARAMKSSADENITIAQSGFFPSLDLNAAALSMRDLPYMDKYEGYTVGLNLTIPLYDKGISNSKTAEAKYTAAYYSEQIMLAKRKVTENLRQSWNNLEARRASLKSVKIRIKANKMALDGVKDEQARGSRTVLDVLDAEQELLDAKVALTKAKHGEISAYFAVLSSVGNLTAENLKNYRDREMASQLKANAKSN